MARSDENLDKLLSTPRDRQLSPEVQKITENCHLPWPAEAPVIDVPAIEAPVLDTKALAEQRQALLEQWEQRTGRSRSWLYKRPREGKRIISQTRFYYWLSGELPEHSLTSRRLEKYLRPAV